nr:MAG TPA: hypothetical protein [Caudoviricetes sp.]
MFYQHTTCTIIFWHEYICLSNIGIITYVPLNTCSFD